MYAHKGNRLIVDVVHVGSDYVWYQRHIPLPNTRLFRMGRVMFSNIYERLPITE